MKLAAALFLVFALVGCGGTASAPPSPTTSSPSPPPTTGGATTTGSTPPAPGAVTVTAGQTTSGVDIAVVAPAASPAINAQDLGVAAMTGAGSAYNTGDVIHRGATSRVLLFGPGLNGSVQVSIVGPPGITVSEVSTIKATDNTPGISFTATVAPNAALGARTVSLTNSQGDTSTFTGGLEVVP